LIRNPSDLVLLPNYDRFEYFAMLVLCIALRRKRAVICDATKHDRRRALWKEIAKRFFFARCDGFLCYGTRSREYLMSYGVPEAKIHARCQAAALPHGYNSAEILSRYGVPNSGFSGAPRYLYVGRLSAEKGIDCLLNAFSVVRTKLRGAQLDLIGAGTLESALLERISELGLQAAVTLRGPMKLSDIAPQFARSVALVLPSYSEPWGLVVNESLSYGCPVVVSSHCGCVPELVIEGVTGYSFEAGNSDALSAALLEAIGLSEDRAATARHCMSVISPYTAKHAATQMLEGFSKMLKAVG
jgi:glycosyltransferase involved in cell wall biosynthesis